MSFPKLSFFPSLLYQYKNSSFLISLNPAVFLARKVNKRSSQLLGSLGNFGVQEKSDETVEYAQACSSTVWFLRDLTPRSGRVTLHRQQYFWVLCEILLQWPCCQVLQKFPGWGVAVGCEEGASIHSRVHVSCCNISGHQGRVRSGEGDAPH